MWESCLEWESGVMECVYWLTIFLDGKLLLKLGNVIVHFFVLLLYNILVGQLCF